MKISKEVIEYLENKKFDDGYKFEIKKSFYHYERIEKILELTKNKKILHLGCCDHIPLIKEKIIKKEWLHKELTENCKEVLGIDINEQALKYVKDEIGYSNILYLDITKDKDNKQILSQKWDYIVLGEILEHTDNPVEFLKQIINNYGKVIEKMIITVPNIICNEKVKKMKDISSEIINSDHRYWFTPFTILKIGINSGMEIKNSNLYFVDIVVPKVFKLKKFFEKILGKKIFRYKFYEFGTLILESEIRKWRR
ncbi:MAG: class I SAM-dependent methyltransferase [Fusobacterium varium]|uniref:class I SAM-dependent methyltransferase n=1 Tax=Fusobacterium varium TaxID=856 RepID=UPI00242A4A9A|nr:class I SAM-dependent methyltransferase [Fusobacterium varium]UYI80039.1 MAG: class I SAM-dependent methyltransferase [Fusobacterium varium]